MHSAQKECGPIRDSEALEIMSSDLSGPDLAETHCDFRTQQLAIAREFVGYFSKYSNREASGE